MKKILLVITAISLFHISDVSAQELTRTPVGVVTSSLNVMSPGRLPKMLENTSKLPNVQIAGYVKSVASDGSWMVISSGTAHNDYVLVKRKTSGFLFTANLIGKQVSAQGDAVKKQLSTEEKTQYMGNNASNTPSNIFEIESTGYYIYE